MFFLRPESGRPLYCVASIHTSDTQYNWSTIPCEDIHPHFPVVHVCRPGIYGCTIHLDGDEVSSELIKVKVIPGQ